MNRMLLTCAGRGLFLQGRTPSHSMNCLLHHSPRFTWLGHGYFALSDSPEAAAQAALTEEPHKQVRQ